MNFIQQEPTDLIPLNIIRSETALTRYPIHRLARRGNIEIEIKTIGEKGETAFRWEVDYSKKRGQPGPLAYKVDTLIINRKIDEAERPLPKIIKLGSLKEIGDEVSSTGDTNRIKNALLQNVGALITAKMRYKGNDGSERTVEFSDTRYGVAFVGEKLPDGREADAVYIILHDWYRELLDTAQTRPLDYDYLKELSPGAQRLYELLSFQMYGAIESERRRAKLLYSDFCTRAPQTRYFDFEHVKKQMYKLHLPHRKSGYIAQVHFQEITDSEGNLDWEMFYTPGLKARGEHIGAKRKPRRKKERQLDLPITIELPQAETKASRVELSEEEKGYVAKLTSYGLSKSEAEKLVRAKLEACRRKIPAIPYLSEGQGKKNQAGNIRAFIERDDWQLPQSYLDAQAKAEEVRRGQARRVAIDACTMCDANGYRIVKTESGSAAKKCSHNAEIEKMYPAAP